MHLLTEQHLFHPHPDDAHCMNLKSSWLIAVCAVFANRVCQVSISVIVI